MHALANAQTTAPVAEASANASDSDTSSDESTESSVASSAADRAPKKSRTSNTTPRKKTSGLQQSGSCSSVKKKVEASPDASASASREELQKMQQVAEAITAQLQKYATGFYDQARGRELQGVFKQWAEPITAARKLVKNDGQSDEKRTLQRGLEQIDATAALIKAVVKASGSYLETASCYDNLKLIKGLVSEGSAKILLDRNVDRWLSNGDSKAAVALMTNHAGASHGVCELMAAEKIPEAQNAVATKVTLAIFKQKVVGSLEAAQREGAELSVTFKHQIGFATLAVELQLHLEFIFTAMNPLCADAASLARAGSLVARFPTPDARKTVENPVAAFLLSKVGKIAVKNLLVAAESAAKADSASKEFAKTVAAMKDFTKLPTFTLRLLQLEVMPLLRPTKTSIKSADPTAVQELASPARTLFVNVGTDLLQRMFDCAPFLFEEVALLTASPAPAKDFNDNVGNLKAFGEMVQELRTDILPWQGALPFADVNQFKMYAELAQEIASTTLSETPPATLQSLRGRLLDLLEPQAWASIAESVSGPTLETPPICDI